MRDFEEIPPFEGELHDHAVSSPSVNITVMSSSLFLLSQIFSRTGGALIGVNGTRLHREAAEAPVSRRCTSQGGGTADFTSVAHSPFTEPSELSRHLQIERAVGETLVFPEIKLVITLQTHKKVDPWGGT